MFFYNDGYERCEHCGGIYYYNQVIYVRKDGVELVEKVNRVCYACNKPIDKE